MYAKQEISDSATLDPAEFAQAGTAWWYGLNHYALNRHDTGGPCEGFRMPAAPDDAASSDFQIERSPRSTHPQHNPLTMSRPDSAQPAGQCKLLLSARTPEHAFQGRRARPRAPPEPGPLDLDREPTEQQVADTAAVSPTRKMSGWLGTDRSTPTFTRPARSCSASSHRAAGHPTRHLGGQPERICVAGYRFNGSAAAHVRQTPIITRKYDRTQRSEVVTAYSPSTARHSSSSARARAIRRTQALPVDGRARCGPW